MDYKIKVVEGILVAYDPTHPFFCPEYLECKLPLANNGDRLFVGAKVLVDDDPPEEPSEILEMTFRPNKRNALIGGQWLIKVALPEDVIDELPCFRIEKVIG